jgi:hypothetical protein
MLETEMQAAAHYSWARQARPIESFFASKTWFIYRIRAVAGIGSACGLGASSMCIYIEPGRQLAYEAPAAWAQARPRTSGGPSSRCTDIHANTAGLHASAVMGLSGRLEFDSSNHGLC